MANGNSSRFPRNAALLLIGAAASLVSALPANALTWNKYQCTLTGLECPQTGTPMAPCDCGLYKDSPGVASTNRKDTAFLFVGSNVFAGDETAAWVATLAAPLTGQVTLEVREAVNDNSDVKVVLYDSVGAGSAACKTSGDASIVAVLDSGDNGADSRFNVNSGPIGGSQKVAAICLIISDSPDAAAPVSKRSSAIVDYIAVISSGGAKTFLEDFGQTQ